MRLRLRSAGAARISPASPSDPALHTAGATRPCRLGALAIASALTAAAFLLILPAAPALAVGADVLTATFGAKSSTPVNPYPLAAPTEVAVDEATHDLYVIDSGNRRIEKFSEKGKFLLMFGGEVDQTTHGDVCPEYPGDLCQPGAPSSSPGAFLTPTFLAVDNSSGPSQGDVYVDDNGTELIQKFDSSGHIVSTWGEGQSPSGQKNGSDMPIPGQTKPTPFEKLKGMDVGPTGILYAATEESLGIYEYAQDGTPLQRSFLASTDIPNYADSFPRRPGLKLDSDENAYFVGEAGRFSGPVVIFKSLAVGEDVPGLHFPGEQFDPLGQLTSTSPTTGLALNRSDNDLYQDTGSQINRYPATCDPHAAACDPAGTFGAGNLSGARGLAVDGGSAPGRSEALYVANTEAGEIAEFQNVSPTVTTEPLAAIGETTATLTGTVDPERAGEDRGPISGCRFEYGLTDSYGHSLPCQPDPEAGPHFTEATAVTAELSGLTPTSELLLGSRYHYRLVASNQQGATAEGRDESFTTAAPPTIAGVSSSHLTATSAELDATVEPNGLPTTYYFEYGPTSAYGETTPSAELTGDPSVLLAARSLTVDLLNLQRGLTYHYRLVVQNTLAQAPVVSEDHSFEFFPPACPNAAVRQQTGSAYLPDCRAYELVSPANANATLLYPGGPNTGQATSPSRLSFTGNFSSIPGADTIDTDGDLYVSTRTTTGWVSKYIGLSGSQAGCMGGPPTNPYNHSTTQMGGIINDSVLTDPSMSRFLDFLDGTPVPCYAGTNGLFDNDFEAAPPSNAPYLWGADGLLQQRLPTGVASIPGALDAFKCPYSGRQETVSACTGETTASGDLTHLIFSSNKMAFAPGGLTAAPGSAYDDDLATGKVTLISSLAGATPIPQDPAYAAVPTQFGGPGRISFPGGKEEFIRFPAISTDGSHILMSTATASTSTCGRTSGGVTDQGGITGSQPCPRFTDTPVHLYMRVDDAATYEIAGGAPVDYVGMTPDGSAVYFTSEESLNPDDQDTGSDLYLWSAARAAAGEDPLTLISKPPGAADADDACGPAPFPIRNELGEALELPWTSRCGALPVSTYAYSKIDASLGGNGISDTAIASHNGDVYFFSPEQLDGSRGVLGEQNLYDYREGRAQFVATLTPEHRCRAVGEGTIHESNEAVCAEGPIVRFEVTPDDTRAAFITASRLTSYRNDGHLEMYSYTPSSRTLVCDSCNPDGLPATADVFASQDGLFLTDDGRAFFSTDEALVPQDTNQATDVYEFVDGRPQLITPGTGTASSPGARTRPGLLGVSADGTDVYLATFDTITSEDHNGNFLKFYDARTNGGFPQPPPLQPCSAAEECHGPGTEAPQLPTPGTAATLSGGNLTSTARHGQKHRKRPRHKRHHHRAGSSHGSGR